ncbi:hypothetical protein ACJX0J_006498 [Zea mays]
MDRVYFLQYVLCTKIKTQTDITYLFSLLLTIEIGDMGYRLCGIGLELELNDTARELVITHLKEHYFVAKISWWFMYMCHLLLSYELHFLLLFIFISIKGKGPHDSDIFFSYRFDQMDFKL